MDSSGYLNADGLATQLKISKRNVYYALEDINTILAKRKEQPLLAEYGKGLKLTEGQRKALNDHFKIVPTMQIGSLGQLERCSFIYCEIYAAKKKLTIRDFEELFEISRFTIINNVNLLKSLVLPFDIEISFDSKTGYVIEGKEYSKRKAFFYFYSNIYTIITDQEMLCRRFSFLDDQAKRQYKILEKISAVTGNGYYDCSLKALACILSNHKDTISDRDVENCLPHKMVNTEYEYVSSVFEDLSENEKEYIATYLYCSSISRTGIFNNIELMKSLARKMNDIFYLLTAIEIHNEEFELSLIKHLDIAFLRYKYGVSIDNPLIGQIKEKYQTYFSITQKAAKVIEKEFNAPLSDNEIGFLTLYYAGYAVKQQLEIPVVKAVLICVNGLSTSYLLKSEIESLDKRISIQECIGLQEYMRGNYIRDCDVVISSIKIDVREICSANVITIGSILTESDKVMITNEASRIIFEKTYNHSANQGKKIKSLDLSEMDKTIEPLFANKSKHMTHISESVFKYEFVQTCDSKGKSFEQMIRYAAQPLIKEKYIDYEYCDAIIANIYKYGPYMVYRNGYLLGHASMQLSDRLGLAFTKLSEPIDVNGREASKIFIITPTDKVNHMPLINSLVMMLESNEINEMINRAENSKELYNLILSVITAC